MGEFIVEVLEEKIEALSREAQVLEKEIKEARAQYTSEQIIAGVERARIAKQVVTTAASQDNKHEEAMKTQDRVLQEALRVGERAKKRLAVECRELEERRAELGLGLGLG